MKSKAWRNRIDEMCLKVFSDAEQWMKLWPGKIIYRDSDSILIEAKSQEDWDLLDSFIYGTNVIVSKWDIQRSCNKPNHTSDCECHLLCSS